MDIRRFEEGDEFRELIKESIRDIEQTQYSSEETDHLIETIPEMTMEFAQDDRFRYFVAEEDEEIIGVAGYKIETGTVSGVFASSDRKGSGIGSKLLNTLEEDARAQGIDTMTVPASLDAVGFYRKNGYKDLKREFKDVNGEEIEMQMMEKEL